MQIVIDINDNEYWSIKNHPDNITSYPVTIHLYEAVRNGAVIPKHYRKIIDEGAITEVYLDETEPEEINGVTIPPRVIIVGTNAPAIIERCVSD